ncbi:hypothetical protein LTS08_000480 [Lithohypha guttulata]|nr:hypothetical protein LTS08_000480 [Lithohypha guttulata]
MAATLATINTWLDQLSISIVKQSTSSKQETRRLQDSFRRRIKKHTAARTNQFEVINRLDGLEEKFQILSLDNLSDALRQRRNELKDFEYNWLPDALDLLLHLAGDPAHSKNLLELYQKPLRVGTPPPLRWIDLQAESPIDKHSRLWRVPDFHDVNDPGLLDDGVDPDYSTAKTSPLHDAKEVEIAQDIDSLLHTVDDETLNLYGTVSDCDQSIDQITEELFIRESMFFLRGYSNRIFTSVRGRYELNSTIQVRGLPHKTLRSIFTQFSLVRTDLDFVLTWIASLTHDTYIAAMKDATEKVILHCYRAIDELQQNFTDSSTTTVASITPVVLYLPEVSTDITAIADFLRQDGNDDAISCLENLYQAVWTSQVCGNVRVFQCLSSILFPTLHVYLQPIWTWLNYGQLETSTFFVVSHQPISKLYTLWHDYYSLEITGRQRPSSFLMNISGQILACGKTSAFLRQLRTNDRLEYPGAVNELAGFMQDIQPDISRPFSASFEESWNQYVHFLLQSRTLELKAVLDTTCGYGQALDTIAQLYLQQDTTFVNEIERKLFNRIDHLMDSWNDRFQLRDMLEEAFNAGGSRHIVDSILIHSTYTSSRAMQSRRTSVEILSSVAFEYVLPWSLANIVDAAAMATYQRIALVLTQIKRAKYCIERTGYISVTTVPLMESATELDQRRAQALAFALLSFVNTIYDHFTTTIIWPLAKQMRINMHESVTIDEMIQTHRIYISRLAHACLAAPKVKALKQSVVAILDLCIHFSDLVSNSTNTEHANPDFEVSSFRSAQSKNRRLRADQHDSDPEDEDQNHFDGYSSFIVLDGDTSVVKELHKVKLNFEKQVKVLVAGLKGVRKGEHAQIWGGPAATTEDSPPAYSGISQEDNNSNEESSSAPVVQTQTTRRPAARVTYDPLRRLGLLATVPYHKYNIPDGALSNDKMSLTVKYSDLYAQPQHMMSFIVEQALLPPKPILRVIGSHGMNTVDFDITLNLAHLLNLKQRKWRFNSAQVSPLQGGTRPLYSDEDDRVMTMLATSVRQFCRDKSENKSYTLTRVVEGLPTDMLAGQVRNLAATVKYRGVLKIDFVCERSQVIVHKQPSSWFSSILRLHPEKKFELAETVWSLFNLSDDEEDVATTEASLRTSQEWWKSWSSTIRNAMIAKHKGNIGIDDWIETRMGHSEPEPRIEWGNDRSHDY